MTWLACMLAIGAVGMLLSAIQMSAVARSFNPKEVRKMSQATQDLLNAVAAEKTASASVLTLLNGLVVKLQAALASSDDAAVEAAVADLAANTATLTQAVTSNTPADPAVPAGVTSSALPATPAPVAVDASATPAAPGGPGGELNR